MKFDELDKKMRVFETQHDQYVLPQVNIVVRLDGRGFTKLTKEKHPFKVPFDPEFRDLMVETTKHLMTCGFNIVFGYTESDEISLLFHLTENTFGRKIRKINSVLAGEASGVFSVLLGKPVCFDCRVCQLPTSELVVDYFRWRNEDCHRNALNSHCYWALRKEGNSPKKATSILRGKTTSFKNELLFQRGIQFNDLPLWQKRGVGVRWTEVERDAFNPISGEEVRTVRKKLTTDLELPMREEYSAMIRELIAV